MLNLLRFKCMLELQAKWAMNIIKMAAITYENAAKGTR
jgi:hypothetical protein